MLWFVIISIDSLNNLLLLQSFSQLSPFCDQSITDVTIDSSLLVGEHLLLFTNRTVTVVDITNAEEPILESNTIEQYFKDCGQFISSSLPIEIAFVDNESNPNAILSLMTKVSHSSGTEIFVD